MCFLMTLLKEILFLTGGRCLFFPDTHFFHLKSNLGGRTNNFVEFVALRYLLLFAPKQGYKYPQVFGDSMLIINLVNDVQRCHVMRLLSLVEEVLPFLEQFDLISFKHVYMEYNCLENRLSKEATEELQDRLYIEEYTVEGHRGYCH